MRKVLVVCALSIAPVLGVATAAQAQAPCDSYSGGCLPTTEVKPVGGKKPTVVKGVKNTLPFTGGEVMLLALTGAGAVTGGTVLVAAGKRRSRKTTA